MLISEAFVKHEIEDLRFNGHVEKTVKNYRSTVHSLLKCTPDIPIEMFTIEHVINWKMFRESMGHATSTISHDLSRLKRVLKFLRKRGYKVLDEDFITLPKVREKAYTWLTYEEVQQLLSVIDSPRDRAIYSCLFATGCRISELLNINRDDIRGNKVAIIGKGDVRGEVMIDHRALDTLHEYLSTRRDDLRPVFISGQHRRITPSRVAQLLHDYADRAGIDKNVTPHVLRHSFATDMKINGADIFDIQKQLRHKRISSTQIYTHISDKQKEETYNKYHSA